MNYETHVFDVDGTLIDTNGVKSRAFYDTALPYGRAAARAIVKYHQSAGSIGRRARWAYFFRHILGRAPEPGELDSVVEACTARVKAGTMKASLIPGALDYLHSLGVERCVVVSGIEQPELEEILSGHGLTACFRDIYGGPRTKPVLLRDLACDGTITRPAVYYGDVEEDYLSARNAGLDFVWVRGFSEWDGLLSVEDFRSLLPIGAA